MALTHQLSIAPRFGTRTRALIVDSHSTTSNILASHLRMLGLGLVVQCARAQEAMRHIAECGFDLILCESRLADGTLGQDLIEELRRQGTLSLRTVVMMVSGDASYNTVAEVAESAVDGFVIRPYSPGGLEDRLSAAGLRKEALSAVFDAIETQRHAEALQICEQMHARRAPYWTFAARLGAELALRLDRAVLASEFFESVLAVKAVPWAKLGIARTLAAGGAATQAVSTIETLLAAEPRYVDAYDVLGKLHAEQGNLQAALTAHWQATQITPASVHRAQKYGILAFYAGEAEVAQLALERAATLGQQSAQFDAQTVLLLALLHMRQKDSAALQGCRVKLETVLADPALALAGQARLARMQRFAQTIAALDHALQGQQAEAAALTAALAGGIEEAGFDIEAATNLLSLLTALHSAAVPLDQDATWVRRLGLRFCISRHATEVLAQACAGHAQFVAALRQAHAEIGEMAQAALGQALAGNPQRAVQQLLDDTESTHNAKLLHSAVATLQRYRDRIATAAELQRHCDRLQQRWGSATVQPLRAEEASAALAATMTSVSQESAASA